MLSLGVDVILYFTFSSNVHIRIESEVSRLNVCSVIQLDNIYTIILTNVIIIKESLWLSTSLACGLYGDKVVLSVEVILRVLTALEVS